MPQGLSLDMGLGGLGLRTAPSGTGGGSAPTVAQQAFGPAYTQPGGASSWRAFIPNDAFGSSFWMGIIGVAGLIWIRHSLPR